ncbi:NB-ARC domain-containing protein [Phytohabitans flavus]|uniref:NB-ARC domain-containing protein n=1 Tax=Phytohabitans flavus TaxID=1076124 RepID=UPI003625C0C6
MVQSRPLWWLAGSTVAVAASGLLVWWAQHRYERGLVSLVPVAQRPESWVVDRPVEVDQIVAALRRGDGGTVGITTAVHGAGGFGKTTVAKLVRADRRVLRRFRGRVYWVTLGRDVRKGALVTRVNDLVRQVNPGRAESFTDLRQAAEHLAAVLALGSRRLIILDDVWFEDQLDAFPMAGRCARLVTTRVPSSSERREYQSRWIRCRKRRLGRS